MRFEKKSSENKMLDKDFRWAHTTGWLEDTGKGVVARPDNFAALARYESVNL
jgi:hypothetical protein